MGDKAGAEGDKSTPDKVPSSDKGKGGRGKSSSHSKSTKSPETKTSRSSGVKDDQGAGGSNVAAPSGTGILDLLLGPSTPGTSQPVAGTSQPVAGTKKTVVNIDQFLATVRTENKAMMDESKAQTEKINSMMEVVKNLIATTKEDQSGPTEAFPEEIEEEGDEEDLDGLTYDDDGNPYQPEDEQLDEVEELEGENLMGNFGFSQKREEPDPLQIVMWECGRKVTAEYSENDWKKLSIKGIVKKFTEHPMACMFSAPKADPQLIDLRFQDRKDREKTYIEIMNGQGAIGALSTKLLVKIQDKADEMAATIKDFNDKSVVIENPREEAGEILTLMKKTVVEVWAKLLSEIAKVSGATFSRVLMLRRQQFEAVTGHFKGAKAQLKRLQPSREFLFGGKVGELCKDLEVSSQLSPLSMHRGRGRGAWSGRSNRGRGGHRGLRMFSRGRGGSSVKRGRGGSARVDRFKED